MRTNKTLAEMLDILPERSEQLRFLGEAGCLAMDLGLPDVADAIFDGLNALAPADPLSWLGKAELLIAGGRFREACASADRALRCRRIDRPTMSYAYAVRGQAMAGLRRHQQASRDWSTAEELDSSGSGAVIARTWRALICGSAGAGRGLTPSGADLAADKKRG